MSLRFTNSLTSRTEAFEPLTAGKASIYCCGVTVYDLCHLGHARSYINWDVLRRYLIWRGLEVTFVQNFTDIDDKILKRAGEENSSMKEVSERNIASFHQDMDALGILRPDRMPRATQCLDGIRALIGELTRSTETVWEQYVEILGESRLRQSIGDLEQLLRTTTATERKTA